MFLRLIRALDAIVYAFGLLTVMLIFPSAGRNELGQFGLVLMIPALALAAAVWWLPETFHALEKWPGVVTGLRAAAIALAGLAPFALYWLRSPADPYLFVNALLCGIALLALFQLLNSLVGQLAGLVGYTALEVEARLTGMLVFYLSLVPYLAFHVVIAVGVFWLHMQPQQVIARLAQEVPNVVILTALFPPVLSVSVLVRARYMITRQYHQMTRELL